MSMRKQNRLFFLILGFHSIHLFSSSKDQVLGPISLVLSCKCRKLLTLLYIIGKLSNYMLYNYMFSSLEMDPGNSFQPKKKKKIQSNRPKKQSHVLSDISFLCLHFMYEHVSFIYFFLLFLYIQNIQILESEALKQDHQEPKYFLLLSVSPAQEKHILFPLPSLSSPLPRPSTDLHVAYPLHSFACFRMIY